MLFVGGIVIVILGLLIMFWSNITYDQKNMSIAKPDTIPVWWDFDYGYSFAGKTPDGDFTGKMVFTSPDVFAVGNPINSTITGTVTTPDSISHIYFIIPENENLTKTLTTHSLMQAEINKTRVVREIIDMQKLDSTHFFNRTSFTYSLPQKISFNVVIENKYGDYFMTQNTGRIFEVESHLSKIQADTDRDIQLQNLESEKTNGHVEGLSVIIIGLIPIGFGIEFFIERHFYGKEDSRGSLPKTPV